MAYISFQPKDYFQTTLYTGDSTDDRTVTGLGFAPDFGWFKERDGTDENFLVNSVLGANHAQYSNSSAADDTSVNAVKVFGADGYTLGINTAVNENTSTYANWSWKAGTTGTDLSAGTIIPSSSSIDTTSGFGIYKYTGTGSNGTVAHGLGVTPDMVMVKRIDGVAGWMIQHIGTTAANKVFYLNTTHSEQTEAAMYNSTRPTSTVFSLGTAGETNYSGDTYMAYVFAGKKGYSKFGKFQGTASATNGPFVYTGFRPAFVLVKVVNYGAAWSMFDDKRLGYNPTNKVFTPNTNSAAAAAWMSNIYSNGFRPWSTDPQINGAYNYVYAAFAKNPLVSSNGIAGLAR